MPKVGKSALVVGFGLRRKKAGIGAMLALQIFLGTPFLQVHCWAGPIV